MKRHWTPRYARGPETSRQNPDAWLKQQQKRAMIKQHAVRVSEASIIRICEGAGSAVGTHTWPASVGAARWLAGGAEMTLADVPFGAELNRWSLCVHACARDGVDVCQLSGRPAVFPRLREYYARLLERPAFRAQVYDLERAHQRLEGDFGLAGAE